MRAVHYIGDDGRVKTKSDVKPEYETFIMSADTPIPELFSVVRDEWIVLDVGPAHPIKRWAWFPFFKLWVRHIWCVRKLN